MEKQSSVLLSQCTERLVRAVPRPVDVGDELRYCDWLLASLCRQVAAIASPEAARALFDHAFLETAPDWPILEQMKVTETGLDTSHLRQFCSQADCESWPEAFRALVYCCLVLMMTISGESIVLSVVDRVEAEMQGLGGWLATFQQGEATPESDNPMISAFASSTARPTRSPRPSRSGRCTDG